MIWYEISQFWYKITLLQAALSKMSTLFSENENIEYKDMPLWARFRNGLWVYSRWQYWTKERPLIRENNKLRKQLGLDSE